MALPAEEPTPGETPEFFIQRFLKISMELPEALDFDFNSNSIQDGR